MTKDLATLRKLVTIAHETREKNSREEREFPQFYWNQAAWILPSRSIKPGDTIMAEGACGTAGCIAGNAVLMAGARTVGRAESWDYDDNMILRSPYSVSEYEVEYEGKIWRVEDLARELLGLTASEADKLFDGRNEINDIDRIISEWEQDAQR